RAALGRGRRARGAQRGLRGRALRIQSRRLRGADARAAADRGAVRHPARAGAGLTRVPLPLALPRAKALLAAMPGRRVLVVGDVMLDEFVWGKVSRISPEAPVPVVQVTGQSFHLGGAGNVAANVRTLGGDAALVGLVGRDVAGSRVREALDTRGVAERLVDAGAARRTTLKTRIVAHGQQVVRADQEDTGELPRALERALVAAVGRELPGAAALVVSDYEKGVVTAGLLRSVLPLARRQRVPVLVDPKPRHYRLYRGATVVTPN